MKTIERELYKYYPKKRKYVRICRYTHDTLSGITRYEGKASVSRTEQKGVYEQLLQDIDDYYNVELQEIYEELKQQIVAKR